MDKGKHRWGWFLQSKLPNTGILDEKLLWINIDGVVFLQSKLPYTGILDEKL